MLHVRLSLMRAKSGQERALAAAIDELVALYLDQRGFVAAYKLSSSDDAMPDIGRVTVWRSKRDAGAAAQSHHVMAKRAEVLALLEDDTLLERSFHAEDGARPLARLVQRMRLRTV